MKKPVLILLVLSMLFMQSRPAVAIPVEVTDYPELWEKAVVVVIGTVESTGDAKNWEFHKSDRWIPVHTVFRLNLVLKGKVTGNTITVEHGRPSDQQKMEVDGPDYVQFNAEKKHEYLMFLKPRQNGKYEPVSCQGCMASNPFILLQPYHISNER